MRIRVTSFQAFASLYALSHTIGTPLSVASAATNQSISANAADFTPAVDIASIFADGAANQVAPVCDMSRYGPLIWKSCDEIALRIKGLGPPNKVITWADRGYDGPHMQIPHRFSSCESYSWLRMLACN